MACWKLIHLLPWFSQHTSMASGIFPAMFKTIPFRIQSHWIIEPEAKFVPFFLVCWFITRLSLWIRTFGGTTAMITPYKALPDHSSRLIHWLIIPLLSHIYILWCSHHCPIIIPNIYPMICPSSSHHDPMVFSYIYILYIYISNGFFHHYPMTIPCLSHIWPIFNSHFCFVQGAPPRPHGNLQALAAEKAAVETNPEEIELDMDSGDSGRRPGAGCKIRWVNHGLIGSYIYILYIYTHMIIYGIIMESSCKIYGIINHDIIWNKHVNRNAKIME